MSYPARAEGLGKYDKCMIRNITFHLNNVKQQKPLQQLNSIIPKPVIELNYYDLEYSGN